MAGEKRVLGWGSIIAIVIGVAVVLGLALGLISRALGFSSGLAAGGVGGTVVPCERWAGAIASWRFPPT
jgi:hypothetical protein